jgi:hypothetical protein
MEQLQQQRLESVKAGCIAAVSFGIVYLMFTGVNLILPRQFPDFFPFHDYTGIDLGIKSAGALGSGFLFGVTYRYIIREDQDSHLQEGAVLAFGLVRVGAVADVTNSLLNHLAWFGIITIESLLGFAVARFSLDFALSRQWLQPFPKETHHRRIK